MAVISVVVLPACRFLRLTGKVPVVVVGVCVAAVLYKLVASVVAVRPKHSLLRAVPYPVICVALPFRAKRVRMFITLNYS